MSNLRWPEYLKEEEEALVEYAAQAQYTLPGGCWSENDFRLHLTTFCERVHIEPQRRRTQLCNKIINSCRPIVSISEEISRSAPGLRATEYIGGPESLVRKISLTALEIGCRHGAGYDAVIQVQIELHEHVPRLPDLTSEPDPVADDRQVQEALHDIYQTFVKLCRDIIESYANKSFNTHDVLHRQQPFQKIISEGGTSLKTKRVTYTRTVVHAKQTQIASSSTAEKPSIQPLKGFTLEFTTVGEKIGEGAHGTVYRVKEKTTQLMYAYKDVIMSKETMKGRRESDVESEVEMLQKLRHPHIISVLLYIKRDTVPGILMEPLADHDLKVYLKNCVEKDFPTNKIQKIYGWFGCLLEALNHAHSSQMNIVHRDIKLTNILVKGNNIYLSDFSVSKDFTGQEKSVVENEKIVGNSRYRAPETKTNNVDHGYQGRKADVFALGCVFTEMLTVICHKSFEDLEEKQKTADGTNVFRDSLPTVKQWLWDLSADQPHNRTILSVRLNIEYMIEETLEQRHGADKALQMVQHLAVLRCNHISKND